MLISIQHRFVFLCTPKCASNSIEDMLQPFSDIALLGLPAVRHTNYREFCHYIKPYLQETAKVNVEQLETVCLMREPLSWLDSWHRFRARPALADPKHPNHAQSTFGVSFAAFIEAYLSSDPPPFAQVASQSEFVADHRGENGVDCVFLYENIEQFITYMSQKVGADLHLKRKNVSPKRVPGSTHLPQLGALSSKISQRLGLQRPAAHSQRDLSADLPSQLLDALRDGMAQDYALYQQLQQHPAPLKARSSQ